MFYRIPKEYMNITETIKTEKMLRHYVDKCVKDPKCKKDDYNKKDPIGIYALIDEEYVCSICN